MEQRGLVVRAENPGDRRTYVVRLTPEGEALAALASARAQAAQAKFLAPLGPKERRHLLGLLRRLVLREPAVGQ